ncbi:MAG: PHP domain-containing protein, partial [Clostridiales bacterium]|nr:PHP domain-containing protein [Clostridiales bacterium]
MKSAVNFHIHTTHSDGGKTPAEVVALLADAGVKYFAITDHDQITGNTAAASLATKYGLEHINGIELSCCFSNGEIDLDESWNCHILGLGIDMVKMRTELARIQIEKDAGLRELFDLLVADGYNIEIKRATVNGRIPARKAISRELINKGYAANGDECY